MHGVTAFAGADASIMKRRRIAFHADDKSNGCQNHQNGFMDFHAFLRSDNEILATYSLLCSLIFFSLKLITIPQITQDYNLIEE
jgi:hypothetical protein